MQLNTVNSKSSLNPKAYRSWGYTKLPCPSSLTKSISVVSNKHGVFGVISLLSPCRPTTIFRRVIAIIINSFKGQPFWLFPHVSKKVLEVLPPVADSNSSPAISMKTLILFVIASCFHSAPRGIPTATYPCNIFRHNFFMKATTRLRCAASKVTASYRFIVAAITNAQPFNWGSRFYIDGNETAKSHSGNVFDVWHNTLRQNIRKLTVWQPDTVSGFQSLNLATKGVYHATNTGF